MLGSPTCRPAVLPPSKGRERTLRCLAWASCGLALLVAAPAAMATIYRCTASDGTKTYSDRPCAPDAKEVEVTPQAPLSGAARSAALVPAACAMKDYVQWLHDQNPTPDSPARRRKIAELNARCSPPPTTTVHTAAPAANAGAAAQQQPPPPPVDDDSAERP